ncbi:MAG TPA: condensation domain-containing protein, partial [Pyrinomonadaceae bacterium]|nr:condensation domain-containing protein [Pyrinomonadaceae bacterium]
MHHIVGDNWSMGVLIREFEAHYEAFSSGRRPDLRELPIQYADYAAWQRQWFKGEVLEEQLEYWKQQLSGEPPVLELPADHARPAVQTERGAIRRLELGQETSKQLTQLSRREGVTLFMTLLGVLNVLLARYTGQRDLVVGTPIAGRNRLETEGLIGFFVNTLVLRTDLSGDPTFRELLQRVREGSLTAQLHQDLPFEKLVEELQPERDLSHTPLFQVMFALQNAPQGHLQLGELQLRQEVTRHEAAKFDLTLALEESDGGLRGLFNYNTDLFEASTIDRMMGHFRNLVEAVIADPERRVSELQLLSDAERQRIVREWNETESAYPRDQAVHRLFEAQVMETPDAVAVKFGDEEVSYAEL